MRRLVVGAGIAAALVLGASPAFATERAPLRDGWKVGTTAITGSPLRAQGVATAVRGTRAYRVGGTYAPAGIVDRTRAMREGAVFDLRTRRWTRLPKLPFHRTLTTGALWAGRRLVVVGTTCPGRIGTEHGCTGGRLVAAAYSPRADSWRTLHVPSRIRRGFAGGPGPLIATREEAIFTIGASWTIAVDPRRDHWRELPPQLTGSASSTCAVRAYAAVLGGSPPGTPNALRLLRPGARSWGATEDMAGFAIGATGVGVPSCTADSVVVTTGDLRQSAACAGCRTTPLPEGSAFARVQRFDLATRRWSDLPPPLGADRRSFLPFGHGPAVDYLDATGGTALRLTPADGTWRPVAPGPRLSGVPLLLWTRGIGVLDDGQVLSVYRPV